MAHHPRVELLDGAASHLVEFDRGDWPRSISSGASEIIELADNNPLVCADSALVPGPLSTLAQIALGPLIKSGLLLESPVSLASFAFRDEEAEELMALGGWWAEAALGHDAVDLGTVLSVTGMGKVPADTSADDVETLYDEAFGRSFFVRWAEAGRWDTAEVAGTPHALFRIRRTPGEDSDLYTVQVMADRCGKAGAAQVVHVFNVMCGFEESLGLA